MPDPAATGRRRTGDSKEQKKSPALRRDFPEHAWISLELAIGLLLLAGLLPAALLLLTRLLARVLALLAGLAGLVLLVLAVHSGSPLLNLADTNSAASGLVAGNLCSFGAQCLAA
jgi:hypothetical protein